MVVTVRYVRRLCLQTTGLGVGPMATMANTFSSAEAYERQMGRWSQRLAPLFVGFVGIRDGERVLDVGCGTGSLCFAIASATRRSHIVGIDLTGPFVNYARSRNAEPRMRFEVGDALALPYPNAFFDKSLASLVLDYIPEAPIVTLAATDVAIAERCNIYQATLVEPSQKTPQVSTEEVRHILVDGGAIVVDSGSHAQFVAGHIGCTQR